jgi:endonuclease/exonuclease/phosphatase family metal-dependent hydrolase
VLTYNIHHGEGVDARLDLDRIARLIVQLDPDLVALQEVDQNTQRTGSVDQAAELGLRTSRHVMFGKSMDYSGGGYGNAVLSRWPIERHATHALPSSAEREPRSALEVIVSPGTSAVPLRFISTHLDHTRDAKDRMAQVERINSLFVQTNGLPVILAGDFNALAETAVVRNLLPVWADASANNPQPTVPAQAPRSRIDYVFVRPAAGWRILRSTVIEESVASDHRPLLVELEWRAAAAEVRRGP